MYGPELKWVLLLVEGLGNGIVLFVDWCPNYMVEQGGGCMAGWLENLPPNFLVYYQEPHY